MSNPLRYVAILLVVGCFWLSGCCRKKPAPPPPAPSYFPVCLTLQAHPRLQWYQESAHTLYVRLFALSAADAFTAASTNALLADPPPAIPGVVGAPRAHILHPGTSAKIEIDANAGEFSAVGIVAGYYKPLGQSKTVLATRGVLTGTCLTVQFGEASIERTSTPATGQP